MFVRIGLVGCVKGKGPLPAPAADLYVSPLFGGRRRFVEQSCDRWFILSALHGLLDPDEVVAPYDRSLVEAAVGERRVWSERVLAMIDRVLGDVGGVVFEVHAGAAYRGSSAARKGPQRTERHTLSWGPNTSVRLIPADT